VAAGSSTYASASIGVLDYTVAHRLINLKAILSDGSGEDDESTAETSQPLEKRFSYLTAIIPRWAEVCQ